MPEPIAYAISCVEPDGTLEVDFRQSEFVAEQWADWCRRDGCTHVSIQPLYSECEIAAARH